jgi:Flp pilus assembly protein CpaB
MARTRGCVWLAAGLIVALLAGVVGFVALSRGAERAEPAAGPAAQGTSVEVVTAAQAIPLRTVLTAEMLIAKNMPVQAAPAGYVADPAEAVGKMTLTDLAQGEILLADRLVAPDAITGNARLALIMSDEQVLMAFPASDLMNALGVLKPGDHVDLLFSMKVKDRTGGAQGGGEEELVTFKALENQVIAAVVGGGTDQNGAASQAKALLLTVAPQDAVTLKYLKDAGAVMDVVLRAPGAEQPMEVEPVDMDRMINEYRLPAAIGR